MAHLGRACGVLALFLTVSGCERAGDSTKEDVVDRSMGAAAAGGAQGPFYIGTLGKNGRVYAARRSAQSPIPRPGASLNAIPAPPDVLAPPAEAQETAAGVFYKVIEPAAQPGDKPGPNDTVLVHYTGWTTDGTMFESSVTRDKRAASG
jgi:hypothetical protein